MNMNEQQLDQLFEQARTEEPQVSYEDTKRMFITASIVTLGGVLATKGLLKLLTIKKGIIMFSAISMLTTASIVAVTLALPSTKTTNKNSSNEQSNTQLSQIDQPVNKIAVDEKVRLKHINNLEESTKVKQEDLILIDNRKIDKINLYPQYNGTLAAIKPAKQNQIQIALNEIEPYSKRFVITNQTTHEELEQIKKNAEQAGAKFDYTAKYRNNKLSKFYFKLEIGEKGNTSEKIQVIEGNIKADEEFEYVIGWSEDENGKVINIKCGDDDDRAELEEIEELIVSEHSAINELLDSLDISEYLAELKNVDFSALSEMSFDMEKLEADLELYEDQMEMFFEQFDASNFTMLDSLTELFEQAAKEMELELEKMEEDMERIEKEREKERKKE